LIEAILIEAILIEAILIEAILIEAERVIQSYYGKNKRRSNQRGRVGRATHAGVSR
jgi:hypothetical protein